MHKAPLGGFLSRNPFPNGLTDGLFYREKMRAIHRVAPAELSQGRGTPRVLDVGGGRSSLAQLLYPTASVVTLDLDAALRGQGPVADAPFVCADARRLPFADASFDAVALFDVLEHLGDDAAAAAEALRVTRPGGWVLVSTPSERWRYPRFGFMRPFCPAEQSLMDEWGHVRRGYAPDALAALFGAPARRSASFTNVLTAFYHDVSFSMLSPRKRKLAYAAAAPAAALGYLLQFSGLRGAELVGAWRR